MSRNNEFRKILIFSSSFIGLFLLSKFVLIGPANLSIPINKKGESLNLHYGNTGIVTGDDLPSLYWGSSDKENFQDIFQRVNHLFSRQASIKQVKVSLHPGLFAQQKFDGKSLDRVIPYYSSTAIFDRVFQTGLSYELVLNFLKYKVGVPFRLTREMNILISNRLMDKEKLPYFSKKVSVTNKPVDYISNTQYLWLFLDRLVKSGVSVEIEIYNNSVFPSEIKIMDLVNKIEVIYKDKIKINRLD